MKVCWLWFYYYKWKFHPYIHHWRPLASIVEHYSEEHLLLQRSIPTLHYGEAKALHNTPKLLLSLSLEKILAPKIPLHELWGSIYNKRGWLFNSPLWPLEYPHDSSTSLQKDSLIYIMTLHIPILTLGISLNKITNNITIYTCTHIRKNRVETTWHPNNTKHYDAWVWGNSSSATPTCRFSVTYWFQAWYCVMISPNCMMVSGWK